MSYFPMFIEMKGRRCLIVGGGKVALHKIVVLSDFGATLHVIAPKIIPEIKQMREVTYQEKEFEQNDLCGIDLVIAATDRSEINHVISCECRKQKIPVNAVDQIEDCSFIFPSYAKAGEVVAAFSSGGLSPAITQYLKEQVKPFINDHLSNLADCLGSLRESIKESVATEIERKQVYQEILRIGLERENIPSQAEIEEVIRRIRK